MRRVLLLFLSVVLALVALSALPDSRSPIDFKHIIGADYKRHTGEPTGGHSLLHGDVRLVEGTESAPDASGVYRAQVQMADPQHPGQWITKTDRNGNVHTFTLDVLDLPTVAKLVVEYRFPAYTGLASRTVEPGGDVAAIKGTQVRLTTTPSMRLSTVR